MLLVLAGNDHSVDGGSESGLESDKRVRGCLETHFLMGWKGR